MSTAMEKDLKGRRISIRSVKKEAAKVRAATWWRCGMSKATFSGVKVTVLWVAYVLLGSLVFQYMEQTTSVTDVTRDHHHWARFKELAEGHNVAEELLELKESLLEICPEPDMNKTFELLSGVAGGEEQLTNITLIERLSLDRVEEVCGDALRVVDHLIENKTISLVDAIYYTMTAVTTIGYGHFYPTTPQGRLFCVMYCLVGVPLSCILLAKSTDLLSSRMHRLYISAQRRRKATGRSLLYWVTVVYLSVGFLVFMLIPSLILSRMEPWTLEESLYVSFITIATIGFGDFYPGYAENAPYKDYQDLYKMAIVVWIMVALSYWFLLLNFLQKVMRKNVPQRLKKSFRSSKTLTKQSEFFRQLVSKVMQQQQQHQDQVPQLLGGDKSSGVVALMVEVADALADDTRRPSLAVAMPMGHRRESKSVAPITLSQLLEVKVSVRGEAVPSIRSFLFNTSHPSTDALQDLLNADTPRQPEVTLPLRQVLNLVTLIKSVDDEVGGGAEVGKQTDGGSSSSAPSSPISTVTSLDHQDCMPLIRSGRKDGKDVLHEVDPDEDEEDEEDQYDEDDDDDDDDEDQYDEDDDDDDDVEDEVVGGDVEKGKKMGGRLKVIL